ncbi:P-loop containing nucleoside triphosphate hydrolase protein [Lyophyllum atratum]|nr:P-loop containing nucleoside triphosphate hydrolase protein [Lyophyllum atratum]
MKSKTSGPGRNAAGVKNVIMQDGGGKDIVIIVMGPPGAGKSTFINAALGKPRMSVGHKMASCTTEPESAVIETTKSPYPALKGHRVVIVDTPGFDNDSSEEDERILQRISAWLTKSYHRNAVLGGVIYLHDISRDQFDGTARMNLEMLNHLCGDAALSKVVLGTTKWGNVTDERGRRHEDDLKNTHWKHLIVKKKLQMRRFRDTEESAMEFINMVLHNEVTDSILEIQRELAVDPKKAISETKAGKWLQLRKKANTQSKAKSKGILESLCIIC